jgi:hypothetical protein
MTTDTQHKSITEMIIYLEKLPEPPRPAGEEIKLYPFHMPLKPWMAYLRDTLTYYRIIAEKTGAQFPWTQPVRLRARMFIATDKNSAGPMGTYIAYATRHDVSQLSAFLAMALVYSGYVKRTGQLAQVEFGKFWTLPTNQYETENVMPESPLGLAHKHGGMVLELRTLNQEDILELIKGAPV